MADSLPPPGGEPTPAPEPPQTGHAAGRGEGAGAQRLGPDGRAPGLLDELITARATMAFLVAVAVVFVLEWRDPGTFTLQRPFAQAVYVKYGGFAWAKVQEGQYWRYLSALFVPVHALNAFIYLFIFFQLGPQLERALGTLRFCILYLGAGMAGIALGDIADPNPLVGQTGTILVVYALLGGIPGMVLGKTGSIRRTVADPDARSAVFWLAFWIVIGVVFSNQAGGWSLAGGLGSAITAAAFGVTLGGHARNPGRSAVLTAFPLVVLIAILGLDVKGYRWLDGRLVERGAIKPGGRDASPVPSPLPSTGNDRAPPATLPERAEIAADQAAPLRERWEPFLDRFGPLPVLDLAGEGLSPADVTQVQDCLLAIEEAIRDPDSAILGELDDLRVRCLILLSRHDAPSAADEYLDIAPSPDARALAGVAYFYRAGRSAGADANRAEDYIESALLADPGLAARLPEAVYFQAVLLYMRKQDAPARKGFTRYLELVGDDPSQAPAFRRPAIEQAKVQLDR